MKEAYRLTQSDPSLSSATRHRRDRRQGITMIECVVAASILLVAMSTVTTMAVRVGRLWSDVAHQRIAMSELTNTLESITKLPADEIDEALKELMPSSAVAASLDRAELTGERIEDEFGERIVLTLSWKAAHPIRPARLVGWIHFDEVSP
ncbi:hypothetical protein [Allorhodopirellula solitaria]|uniref:Prepilin-type N-terminal cleavage/methylation domain-containing protein n=1 Tax=Allorhodopirellula solitaria TaxID=2527987 RepID=A0A5C5YKR6_9BACT|nr:hypothetical protein [Allorhodopirellula solitaria]TWT75409.1 hypothetical protein CA85_07000 [Allorhodopirellula solitaria]